MPYLPNLVPADNNFTPLRADELRTHCRMVIEMYERHYPLVRWSMIDHTRTSIAPDSSNKGLFTGQSPGTILHPLYGDAVSVQDGGTNPPLIVNPHTDADVQAPKRIVWKAPIEMNVHIEVLPPNDSKEKEGKIGKRDIVLNVATPVADKVDITVNEGDRVEWRGVQYSIKETFIPEGGYWLRNTNIPIYIRCYAAVDTLGS